MKRFTAQWMLSHDRSILRNRMIELTDRNEIVQLVDLNHVAVETANTIFLNGVIAPEIVSINQRSIPEESIRASGMGLFSIRNAKFEKVIQGETDDFILDFSTEDSNEINSVIKNNFEFLAGYSLEDIIFACTYAPALLVQKDNPLKAGNITKLSFWADVDFVNHKLGASTKLSHL